MCVCGGGGVNVDVCFFGNVWVGVYGGDSCVCDCVRVMCV